MCLDGQHKWVVPDEDEVRQCAWAKGLPVQAELTDSLNGAMRGAQTPQVVVLPRGAPNQQQGETLLLDAETAERWLREPVLVLVENTRTDGGVLRHFALRVGEARWRRLLGEDGFARLKRRWVNGLGDRHLVMVLHGGGDTIADLLEQHLEAGGALRPRLFILVDSDRGTPPHPEPTSRGPRESPKLGDRVQAVLDAHQDGGLGPKPRLHVLQKRAIENYLPHGALHKVRRPETDIVDADLDNIKQLFGNQITLEVLTKADNELHASAWRKRAGQQGAELDAIVSTILSLL